MKIHKDEQIMETLLDDTPDPADEAEFSWDMFVLKLEALLNEHSVDNELNIPDYLLAEHIVRYLKSLKTLTAARDAWFDFKPFGWLTLD